MNEQRGHEALIDAEEVATELGVTVRFVRRLVHERRIPFHRIGRHVRFDRADVEAFIAEGRVEPYPSRGPGATSRMR